LLEAAFLKSVKFILFLITFIGIYCLGPVVEYPPIHLSHETELPQRLGDLEKWLDKRESAFEFIKPQNEQQIVWASEKKEQTPWSIVYIHGFSSSRLETAPLSQEIANKLKANVFYTRLTGHGQHAADLAHATPQD